jgi:ABC-2 type transport system permease protein
LSTHLINNDVNPESRSRLFWLISDSWVLAKRSIRHITRNLDQLLSAVLSPIMFFLLFRFVFGGAIDTGNISYVNFLIAGMFVQMLTFGANNTTISLAVDLKRGIINRFKSLPMSRSALLIGQVCADLVRNIMTVLIVIGVSFLVGFQPAAGPIEWMLIILLATLFSVAISWLAVIMGLFIKSAEGAQLTFFVIFPLAFISSAYVPPDTMPEPIMIFAENQPFTHVIEAMRAWMNGTPIGDSWWLAFVWCVGIIIFAMPLATWIFKRKTLQ